MSLSSITGGRGPAFLAGKTDFQASRMSPPADDAGEPRARTPIHRKQPAPAERMVDVSDRVQKRLENAVDERTLSPRQASALAEVEKGFERMMGRLTQAAFDGEGVPRDEVRSALDYIYGKFLDSLDTILAAGQSKQPVDASAAEPAHGSIDTVA